MKKTNKLTKMERLMNVSECSAIVCSSISSIITALVFTYVETRCAVLFIALAFVLPVIISYMIMRGTNDVMDIYLENDTSEDDRLNDELMVMTASTPTIEVHISEEDVVKRVKRER